MAVATTEVNPYRSYAPSYARTQSDNPQIKRLEQKVHQLVLRLQREEKRICCGPNADVIADLRSELEETICQRDQLYQRVIQLTHALRASDELLGSSNSFIAGLRNRQAEERSLFVTGGMGFGGAAAAAAFFSLGPVPTIVMIASGTLGGIFLGEIGFKKAQILK